MTQGTPTGAEAVIDAAAKTRTECLRASGLVKSFRGRKVVKGVAIEVRAGEVVGLLGPNGAGKTTIFDMMVGICQPDEGDITFNGESVTDLPMFKRARRGIGYLPQESSVFRRLSVEHNVLAILEMLGYAREERIRSPVCALGPLALRSGPFAHGGHLRPEYARARNVTRIGAGSRYDIRYGSRLRRVGFGFAAPSLWGLRIRANPGRHRSVR